MPNLVESIEQVEHVATAYLLQGFHYAAFRHAALAQVLLDNINGNVGLDQLLEILVRLWRAGEILIFEVQSTRALTAQRVI